MIAVRCVSFLLLIFVAMPAQAQLKQVIIGGGLAVAPAKKANTTAVDDKKTLQSMNLNPDDAEGLIKYFRGRTLSDQDRIALEKVIDQLGDENFEKRLSATRELEKFGPGVMGILRRTSQTNPDPEIAFRASEALKNMEKTPQGIVASAAARALAKLKAPEAASTLIAFIPMSDTKLVEMDIRKALESLAIRENKIDPALIKALSDQSPMRRCATVGALLRGTIGQPALSKEAVQAVSAIIPGESDLETKFEATYTLATQLKDKDSISFLIDLLPQAPRGRLWQIEDFLMQLAGPKAPNPKMGPGKPELEKARDDWKKWYTSAQATLDLKKFTYQPKTTGHLLLLSADQVGYSNAIIGELGPDMERKWRFGGVYCPADITPLPNGNILVLEQQYNRITERDLTGNQVSVFNSQNYGQPFGFDRLENGNTLVAFQRTAVEYDKDWKETGKKYSSQTEDIVDIKRDTDGTIFLLTRNQSNRIGKIVRLDENWKEKGKSVTTGVLSYYQYRLQILPEQRVLVAEQNRAAEYDLKAEKKDPVWSMPLSNAAMAERLPNGNTLVSDQGSGGIREVTLKNEVVWSFNPPDGRVALRAVLR